MVSPKDILGVPWAGWRPGQSEAVQELMAWLTDGPQQVAGLSMGTGGGKSLIPLVLARLGGRRTVILTSTKGLQDQYVQWFGEELEELRGMGNYPCKLQPGTPADNGVCTIGEACPHRNKGCYYFDQVRRARTADVAITNYAYYFSTDHFQDRELVVCDEAHKLEAAMDNALTRSIPYKGSLGEINAKVQHRINDLTYLKDHATLSSGQRWELKRLTADKAILRKAVMHPDRWVLEPEHNYTLVAPIRPAEWLTVKAPKVLLMSATLTKRHLERLSLDPNDALWLEYGSSFPAKNTPIRHVWTARVNHYAKDEVYQKLTERVDEIIGKRSGRGVVFTSSYKLTTLIMERTKHKGRMVSHTAHSTAHTVREWRKQPGAVIVTPSLVDGWDLPEADFIIVAKLPYPDTSSGVEKARAKEDPQWAPFQAMQTMVQECGRGTRSEGDKCEVWVVDDSWRWFWERYRHYAPGWFAQRVQGSVKEA